MHDSVSLDPSTVLSAYAQGVFPMANRAGAIQWFSADPRGIIPLDAFHVPHSLRPLVRRSPAEGGFEIRINHSFETTMRACREKRLDGTWINDTIVKAYVRLHHLGFAHSVECWKNGELAGGLYGVSLGSAFFGESMFHRARDASKVALVHLINRLSERGFKLLDTQATTKHLEKFGCIGIPAKDYLARLHDALELTCTFD